MPLLLENKLRSYEKTEILLEALEFMQSDDYK